METPEDSLAKQLQIAVAKLDGKRFKFDDDKQDMWPGEKFLQLHNIIFHKKREANRMKAQAEAQELSEEDSSQTLAAEREESIAKVQTWDALFGGETHYANKT
jgi:hypothetical protein